MKLPISKKKYIHRTQLSGIAGAVLVSLAAPSYAGFLDQTASSSPDYVYKNKDNDVEVLDIIFNVVQRGDAKQLTDYIQPVVNAIANTEVEREDEPGQLVTKAIKDAKNLEIGPTFGDVLPDGVNIQLFAHASVGGSIKGFKGDTLSASIPDINGEARVRAFASAPVTGVDSKGLTRSILPITVYANFVVAAEYGIGDVEVGGVHGVSMKLEWDPGKKTWVVPRRSDGSLNLDKFTYFVEAHADFEVTLSKGFLSKAGNGFKAGNVTHQQYTRSWEWRFSNPRIGNVVATTVLTTASTVILGEIANAYLTRGSSERTPINAGVRIPAELAAGTTLGGLIADAIYPADRDYTGAYIVSDTFGRAQAGNFKFGGAVRVKKTLYESIRHETRYLSDIYKIDEDEVPDLSILNGQGRFSHLDGQGPRPANVQFYASHGNDNLKLVADDKNSTYDIRLGNGKDELEFDARQTNQQILASITGRGWTRVSTTLQDTKEVTILEKNVDQKPIISFLPGTENRIAYLAVGNNIYLLEHLDKVTVKTLNGQTYKFPLISRGNPDTQFQTNQLPRVYNGGLPVDIRRGGIIGTVPVRTNTSGEPVPAVADFGWIPSDWLNERLFISHLPSFITINGETSLQNAEYWTFRSRQYNNFSERYNASSTWTTLGDFGQELADTNQRIRYPNGTTLLGEKPKTLKLIGKEGELLWSYNAESDEDFEGIGYKPGYSFGVSSYYNRSSYSSISSDAVKLANTNKRVTFPEAHYIVGKTHPKDASYGIMELRNNQDILIWKYNHYTGDEYKTEAFNKLIQSN